MPRIKYLPFLHIVCKFGNNPTDIYIKNNKIKTQNKINKHKVICEQRLYINLCTQMKTIATITGLPMYAHWPGRVFVYVWGLK